MSRLEKKIIELEHWLGQKAKIDPVDLSPFRIGGGPLYLLREDGIMEEASGNKLRKLIPNLKSALQAGINRIVTFGGAYSNHIAATAAAGQKFGFETIGLIRGEELALKINENPTLSHAQKKGMNLFFLNRSEYRQRFDPVYLAELRQRFAPCLIIPEGGSNDLAVEGVAHMASDLPEMFRILCTPIGTGGTMAGVLNGARLGQQ
ncbi:MAG: pyridoxal-phosphate dependent enzyme, partial [Flavobacteriaceae bacterium]|nr:pyridoxal-phosphate dependent enzyme [Flavobacteriaceae bacterium]